MKTLHLPKNLLKEITTEANRKSPNESGGVLLGYIQKNNIYITNVVGSGPNAKHKRTSFSPDYDFQEKNIEKIYNKSNGSIIYLGDWHSHPKSSSYMSPKDKAALLSIGQHPPAYNVEPIMIVIGGGPDWELNAWQLEQLHVAGFKIPYQYKKIKINLD